MAVCTSLCHTRSASRMTFTSAINWVKTLNTEINQSVADLQFFWHLYMLHPLSRLLSLSLTMWCLTLSLSPLSLYLLVICVSILIFIILFQHLVVQHSLGKELHKSSEIFLLQCSNLQYCKIKYFSLWYISRFMCLAYW